jgi:phospholipid-binding lipoprotein MlaA
MKLSVSIRVVSVVILFAPFFVPSSIFASDFKHRSKEIVTVAENSSSEEDDDFTGFDESDEEISPISDPFESLNRATFAFNDKLYFWVLKPLAQFNAAVLPEGARNGISNFFSNITTPIRYVNSLLQFRLDKASIEIARFFINSTYGFIGFRDPAKDKWNIVKQREDFGQTIGHYKGKPLFYINWPVLGPSNVRDSIGMVGDYFLDPRSYLFPHEEWAATAIKAYDKINELSLNIDLYEDLKKDALDPYSFFRDAYHQHRESLIKE